MSTKFEPKKITDLDQLKREHDRLAVFVDTLVDRVEAMGTMLGAQDARLATLSPSSKKKPTRKKKASRKKVAA